MPDTQDQVGARVTVKMEPEARESLETDVSDKMADIFKDDDTTLENIDAVATDDGAKPATTPTAKEPEAEPVAAEPEPEPTAESQDEPPAAEKEPAAKPTLDPNPAAASLPAAYRRSLKAYQWTDEEIEGALKANPEGFIKTAERIHTSRVEETRRWADLGRQSKASQAPAAKTEPAKPFDAKALRDKYGNEPFIDVMEQQARSLESAQTFITQAQEREQRSAMETLGRQIDGFFGSKDLEPYADHYGKAGSTITDGQSKARTEVLETADLLISGARSHGRALTLDEALTLAHDSVSGHIKAAVAVKKIQQSAQTRQAAISLRPGSRAATPKPGDNRKALEKNVATGLTKAFGK